MAKKTSRSKTKPKPKPKTKTKPKPKVAKPKKLDAGRGTNPSRTCRKTRNAPSLAAP